jgi:hypothetical protein
MVSVLASSWVDRGFELKLCAFLRFCDFKDLKSCSIRLKQREMHIFVLELLHLTQFKKEVLKLVIIL